MAIGFIFLLLLYSALHVYLARRVAWWVQKVLLQRALLPWKWLCFCLPYALLALSFPVGFFLPPIHFVARMIRVVGYHWLGFFLYFLMALVLVDLVRLLLHFVRKFRPFAIPRFVTLIMGWSVLAFSISLYGYGVLHAQQIVVRTYPITIEKECTLSSCKIVLFSDLHLGTGNGVDRVREIVEKIEEIQPDLVCFAGDFIDNDIRAVAEKEEISRLFREIDARYGVYACLGNHDVDGISESGGEQPKLKSFLQECGIRVLEEEAVLVADAFYLVGRKDARPIQSGASSRLSMENLLADLDRDKPLIVLDHQPKEISQAEKWGVDLILSGHTHGGQLFPVNLLTDRMFLLDAGYERFGNTHAVVSTGVGFWGPPLRVGSDCELVVIPLLFSET